MTSRALAHRIQYVIIVAVLVTAGCHSGTEPLRAVALSVVTHPPSQFNAIPAAWGSRAQVTAYTKPDSIVVGDAQSRTTARGADVDTAFFRVLSVHIARGYSNRTPSLISRSLDRE